MSASVRMGAMQVVAVEPGTEITDERTGKVAVVSNSNAVVKHGTIYCTQTAYDAIKARSAT